MSLIRSLVDGDLDGFRQEFESFLDQCPFFLYHVSTGRFLPVFFFSMFATAHDANILKANERVYFRFDNHGIDTGGRNRNTGNLKVAVYRDGQQVVRCYSISDRLNSDGLRFSTRERNALVREIRGQNPNLREEDLNFEQYKVCMHGKGKIQGEAIATVFEVIREKDSQGRDRFAKYSASEISLLRHIERNRLNGINAPAPRSLLTVKEIGSIRLNQDQRVQLGHLVNFVQVAPGQQGIFSFMEVLASNQRINIERGINEGILPYITRIYRSYLGSLQNDIQNRSQKFESHGFISPLLANVALHGLGQHIKEKLKEELFQFAKMKYGHLSYKNAQKTISIIAYADDFVILHESEEVVLKAKVLAGKWLKTIGLKLNLPKTKIKHTLKSLNIEKPGFDFLGFTIRHYPRKRHKRPYKLIINPSCKSVKQHTLDIKQRLKRMLGITQEAVIRHLNPVIGGWCRYYNSVVSSKIFKSLDNIMFNKLWKWAVFRHNNKGKFWIKDKYFKRYKNDNWRFMSNNGMYLINHGDHAIKRHIKVLQDKSPYDGDWLYWGKRLSRISRKSPKIIKLLKIQQSKCKHCQLLFRYDDIIEVHHQDKSRNNNNIENLSLLHGHCHDQVHKKCA